MKNRQLFWLQSVKRSGSVYDLKEPATAQFITIFHENLSQFLSVI